MNKDLQIIYTRKIKNSSYFINNIVNFYFHKKSSEIIALIEESLLNFKYTHFIPVYFDLKIVNIH